MQLTTFIAFLPLASMALAAPAEQGTAPPKRLPMFSKCTADSQCNSQCCTVETGECRAPGSGLTCKVNNAMDRRWTDVWEAQELKRGAPLLQGCSQDSDCDSNCCELFGKTCRLKTSGFKCQNDAPSLVPRHNATGSHAHHHPHHPEHRPQKEEGVGKRGTAVAQPCSSNQECNSNCCSPLMGNTCRFSSVGFPCM